VIHLLLHAAALVADDATSLATLKQPAPHPVYAIRAPCSCLLLLLQLCNCCQDCRYRFLNPYFFRS
jgi:hypothetical protein